LNAENRKNRRDKEGEGGDVENTEARTQISSAGKKDNEQEDHFSQVKTKIASESALGRPTRGRCLERRVNIRKYTNTLI